MFCPKCKRTYPEGEIRCPVDSTPLVRAPGEGKAGSEGAEDESPTHPKYQGPTPSLDGAPGASNGEGGAPAAGGIDQLMQAGGPKLPALAMELDDDDDIKTTLDAPPPMDEEALEAGWTSVGEALLDAATGETPLPEKLPDAYAQTMHAMDQKVGEAIGPGLSALVVAGRSTLGRTLASASALPVSAASSS